MKVIDKMFAFIANDGKDEGLVGAQFGATLLPLVAADMERVESLRDVACQIAETTGKTISIVEFSTRRVLEVINQNCPKGTTT